MSAKNLIKRGTIYHVRFSVNGKETWRSTGTGDERLAKQRARIMMERARNQKWGELEQLSVRGSRVVKVGDVIDRYLELAEARRLRDGEPKERTAWNYVLQLQMVIRVGAGVKDPREQPISILTRDLVERFTAATVGAVESDETMKMRYRRTAASSLRQARSVLARWTADGMSDFKLPDLSGFTRARGEKSGFKKYQYPHVLAAPTVAAGRALRTVNAGLYAAFLLCYDLGMRAGEAAAARWDWVVERGGQRYMAVIRRAYFVAKNKKDRFIPISNSVWEHLQEIRRAEDEWIIPGGAHEVRYKLIERDLAQWMRGLGWDRREYKGCAHELRKLIGSRWYTEHNPAVAADWLGDTLQVVYNYYCDLATHPAPLEISSGEVQQPVVSKSIMVVDT